MPRSQKLLGAPRPTVALHNTKWGSGQTIRYMIKSLPKGFTSDTVSQILRDGFQQWKVGGNLPLVFQEVTAGDCEITIEWTQDSSSFIDGYVAGSDFPPNRPGTANRILLNGTLRWTDPGRKDSTYDIRMLTLHEIGHAIGLDHSTSAQPVMSGLIGGGPGHSLTPADTDAAQAQYHPTLGQKVVRALRSVFFLEGVTMPSHIRCGPPPGSSTTT